MDQKSFVVDSVRGESPVPAKVRLNPAWGERFGREWGAALSLPHGNFAAIFLDKRLSGGLDEIMQVLGADAVAGHISTCDNKEWTIKVEPTAPNRCGIAIYSASGKALMAGEGEITASGQWRAEVKTLYPGIRNSKKVTAQFGARGGTGQKTEIEGGIGLEY